MINLPQAIRTLDIEGGYTHQLSLSMFSRSQYGLRDFQFSTAFKDNAIGRQLLLDQSITLSLDILSGLRSLELNIYDRTLLE